MTLATRRLHLHFHFDIAVAGLTAITLVVVACGPGTSSGTPSGGSSGPSATPSTGPTATLAATATPTSSPTPATAAPSTVACVVKSQTGQLPTDRLVDIKVSTGATADRLTFVFGSPSLPGPASPPVGTLEVAKPPYSFAGSGAPIAMAGARVVQIRFSGMSLSNDAGQETYVGPPEIKPDLPALRHAVMYDASEGIVGWYLGYDGPSCVTLARAGTDVTVTIDHP
jgi:hypothetical protein